MRRFPIACLTACALPLSCANMGNDDNFAARTLACHNRERALQGVPALRWDARLANDAAIWALHLTRVGYLVHSVDNPANPHPEGENLWAGTKGYYAIETMVGLWAGEKREFRQGAVPTNSRTGSFEDVGHYTQMMWRSTHRVGCALVTGKSDDFLVCRYGEGGNVIGERPF